MKKHHQEDMQRLYQEWLSGTMNIKAYCQQKGIKHSTFHYWKKKFHQQDLSSTAEDKGFSRFSISSSISLAQNQQPSAVLNFPSGVRLGFFTPVEPSFLKELLF